MADTRKLAKLIKRLDRLEASIYSYENEERGLTAQDDANWERRERTLEDIVAEARRICTATPADELALAEQLADLAWTFAHAKSGVIMEDVIALAAAGWRV